MKVKSVKRCGIEPVYNITVDEFHNYMIHSGIIVKNCDALRYYAVTRLMAASMPAGDEPPELGQERLTDYDAEMTGGDMDEGYLNYG